MKYMTHPRSRGVLQQQQQQQSSSNSPSLSLPLPLHPSSYHYHQRQHPLSQRFIRSCSVICVCLFYICGISSSTTTIVVRTMIVEGFVTPSISPTKLLRTTTTSVPIRWTTTTATTNRSSRRSSAVIMESSSSSTDNSHESISTTTSHSNHNDDGTVVHSNHNNYHQQQQQQQQRRSIATTTGAFAVTVSAALLLLFHPSPVLAAAIDLTTTATTTTMVAQTWYSSFTGTGFYQAFSLVFLSELGDKTFFIAGLLAMKTNRIISLIGSLSALTVMTILSVIIGQIFHVLPTFGGIADGIPLDDIAAAIAFAFFGVKILKEALDMDDDGTSMMDEEFAEAEETVKDNEKNVILNSNRLGQIASIFGLVFAAEFGDRSFVSTIALSAAQNPISVAGGAIAAHAIATGIAVAGGSVVAKYLSEKVIGIIGGTLFLVFAATTVLGIF